MHLLHLEQYCQRSHLLGGVLANLHEILVIETNDQLMQLAKDCIFTYPWLCWVQ